LIQEETDGKAQDGARTLKFKRGDSMIKINPYHVLNLIPQEGKPCLSIYARTEKELASLVGKAEEIGLRSYSPQIVDQLLKPIHRISKNVASDVSNYPLALFVCGGFSGYAKLPLTVSPLVVVADSFHVKPLFKWMQREHPFMLLCLNDNEANLYQGSLSHFEEIEKLPYKELRTMDGVFNALDRAVYRSIQSTRVPLILAGDLELIEVYRNLSGYRAIVDDSIIDPVVFGQLKKLHSRAIEILEPFLEQRESGQLTSFWAADRSGRTSWVLQEIIQFALRGKVKHLFVNEKMNVWGKIDYVTGQFTYSAKQNLTEDDILDDLAEIVMRNHGMVTVLPPSKMPHGRAACAILNSELSSLRISAYSPDSRIESWPEQSAS